MKSLKCKTIFRRKRQLNPTTPRPRTALLMCQEKYSELESIELCIVKHKLKLETVLLEVSYGKND